MNASYCLKCLSAHEYAALMDAAMDRAAQARAEAIDGFWRATARGLRRQLAALHLGKPRATRMLEA